MDVQLKRGILDACVLTVLRRGESYGYRLVRDVGELIDVSESTLYPVLRRLQKSGLLTTYDKPYQGRNRRYYSITPEGSRQLQFFRNEWEIYKDKINQLIDPATHAQADLLSMMRT